MKTINPTDCLYYLISRASLISTSALKKGFALAGVEQVRPAYLGVLMTLWNEDGLQVADLGRKAGLEPSTMTGLLDRMERDGVISRQADPNDRRAQRIYLTESGSKSKCPVMKVVDQILARATAGISEDEMNNAKSILKKFLVNSQEIKGES